MTKKILEALGLGAGTARSIALERDLYDKEALSHYLVTPAAIAALRQLGKGLSSRSEQRAWKVVGPYGSGKSALGVVAGQLMAGSTHFASIAASVSAASPEAAKLFAEAKRYPVALVGSRVSLGSAMARALSRVLAKWDKTKEQAAFRRRLDEQSTTYDGVPVNSAIGAMSSDFANAAIAAGFQGVVFLVDELGKFVEHAALHPEDGDLMALQQLAEQACGSGDSRIAVIAMLHQHVSSYGGNVDRSLSEEWEKVASRFEEIPFDEPIERYAHFAAHALEVGPSIATHEKLVAASRGLFWKAVDLGVLKAQAETDTALFNGAERLYPLHPLVIAASAVIAKRFGQSERSFHGFLRGDEPFALRQFAETHDVSPANWYRLSDLYDSLAAGHGIRFRDRNSERRWLFAMASVDREKPDSSCALVLKVIAVLELIQSGLRLAISSDMLGFALDSLDSKELRNALDVLVGRGLLIRRQERDEFSFAVPETANVEALYEAATADDEKRLLLQGLSKALASRPVVAHRHYDSTGTLRTMGIVVGTPDAWPTPPKAGHDELQPDAWLKLVVVTAGSENIRQMEQRFQLEFEPLTVHACLPLRPEGRRAIIDYAAWLSVQYQLNVKHIDPWADQYVSQHIQDAREQVERLVTAQLSHLGGRSHVRYWHLGRVVEKTEDKNLSQLASWLFDDQYTLAPRVVNELINKDRPPSAITLARQRMFEVLLSGNNTMPLCRPTEFPPERLIRHTLLESTGIYVEAPDGRWHLEEPKAGATVDIDAVWKTIGKCLRTPGGVTVQRVLDELALPPLGVRTAPAGVWVACYLTVRRQSCAVFERGSLVLELTPEHLMRMFKTPRLFEMRELADEDETRRLMTRYHAAFASIGCAVNGEATHLELTRALYRWLSRLPSYALNTTRLSKDVIAVRTQLIRSQNHIELLTKTLPAEHVASKSKEPFETWLSDVLSELGAVGRRLQDEVAGVLSAAFEIPGTLNRVRLQLQRECSVAAADLGEAHLKAFVLRCADLTLTDERWLDSLASLVVHRPLDSWVDDTVGCFQTEINLLCAHYKRWIRAVAQRSRNPAVGERWVSLTMTLPGGNEAAVFVVGSDQSKTLSSDLVAKLRSTTSNDRNLMLAVLGQALLDCQAESATVHGESGGANDHQKAS